MLKKLFFTFALCLLSAGNLWAFHDDPDSPNENQVIFHSSNGAPTLTAPGGTYNLDTHILTICFPVIGFSNYTIEVSSMYATLEYYIYTPTAQFNLSQMLEEQVDLVIYTEDGDLYWATVDTTDPDEPSE